MRSVGDINWDAVRDDLGITYDEGSAWFYFVTAPYGFAPQKTAQPRPVVLAKTMRYKNLAFPRSASSSIGIKHDAHHAHAGDPACHVTEPGRIVTTGPGRMQVPRSKFNAVTFACTEPDDDIVDEIRGAC